METAEVAAALKQTLERQGEADPSVVLGDFNEPDDGSDSGFLGFVQGESIQDRTLASLSWGGGGAPISSFLSIHAARLADEWFVYIFSDDFGTRVLDCLEVLDAQTATAAVENICGAHGYVSEYLPDQVAVDPLVDRTRIVACFRELD